MCAACGHRPRICGAAGRRLHKRQLPPQDPNYILKFCTLLSTVACGTIPYDGPALGIRITHIYGSVGALQPCWSFLLVLIISSLSVGHPFDPFSTQGSIQLSVISHYALKTLRGPLRCSRLGSPSGNNPSPVTSCPPSCLSSTLAF